MIIAIHQPNFFPWLGYFQKISRADHFVFLDDVAIVKTGSSYTNRVGLCVQGSFSWFSAPIRKFKPDQLICETEFFDPRWKKKLKSTLLSSYSKSRYFKENVDFVFYLLEADTTSISKFNAQTITCLADYFNLKSQLSYSSDYQIKTKSSERLIDIIKLNIGSVYLSGYGADSYQDNQLFEHQGIKVIYNDFPHPVYQQVRAESFIEGLSILDILFNIGREALIEHFERTRLT